MKLLSFLALALFAPSVLRAEPPAAEFAGKGLHVELVSEVTSIRPGEAFYMGLSIHHEGGSHTYWKNPGLAGVATRLEWNLPEGWQAGEIEWPAPDKVKMASIDTHGYERDVLLMVKLTPPAQTAEKSIAVKAMAAWMCCARTCHPGFCNLALTLPIESRTATAWDGKWHPVFESERLNLPVPVSGWQFTAQRQDKHVILKGTPTGKITTLPDAPVFLSLDNLICSHPAQVWTSTATGFEARLEMSDLPPKDQSTLRGLLRSKSGWLPNSERAVEIEVPIQPR